MSLLFESFCACHAARGWLLFLCVNSGNYEPVIYRAVDVRPSFKLKSSSGNPRDSATSLFSGSAPSRSEPHPTLYHGYPLPIFLARTRFGVTARLSLRQEGRTRVEALVEGDLTSGQTP